MKKILLVTAACLALLQGGLSARPAVVNPLYWDDAFSNVACRDTVQYVYFSLSPESRTDTVLTGDTLFFAHTVYDSGSMSFRVLLADSSAHPAGVGCVVYSDPNDVGNFNPGTDLPIDSTALIAPDAGYNVLIGVFVPFSYYPDGTVDTVRIVSTSLTNPAWTDTILDYAVIRLNTATSCTADLSPNTAVVGSTTQFTYELTPAEGAADEFLVLNPFAPAITVDSIFVNTTKTTLQSAGTRPGSADGADWTYSGDTLRLRFAENRVRGDSDRVTVYFRQTMPQVPTTDTYPAYYKNYSAAGFAACINASWALSLVPAAVDSYVLATDSLLQTAGIAFSCSLTALDRYGNITTNYDTTGIGFTWAGPDTAPDGTPAVFPSDALLRTYLRSTVNGGTRGRAVFNITIYDADPCSLLFTDDTRGLGTSIDSLLVRHNTIDSLYTLPPSAIITTDDALQCTAFALDLWHNEWDATDSAATAWTKQEPTGTLVQGLYSPVTVGTWRVYAVNGGNRDTTLVVVRHGGATAVSLTPPADTVTADQWVSFTFTATDADGNSWDVTDTTATTWNTTGSQSAVASGVYQADTAGAQTVIATYDGLSDTATVVVVHGVLTAIDVTPASAAITTDSTLQLSAAGTDGDGNTWNVTLDDSGTAWSTTEAAHPTINDGSYNPSTQGNFIVIAANNGHLDSCLVYVMHGAAVSLVVTPATDTVTADDSTTMSVRAYDADGTFWTVTDTAATTWLAPGSTSPVTGGVYRADTAGTWHVTAVYDGVRDTCIVTVVHGALVTITVTPASAVITTDSTLQLTAQGTDGDGNVWNVTLNDSGTAWSTTEPAVTVNDGQYSPALVGTYLVVAINNARSDTASVTVRHGGTVRISVTPPTRTMTADDTLILTARAYDAENNSWIITDTSATTWLAPGSRDAVSAGVYRADTVGVHRIIAIYDGFRDTCIATVVHGAVDHLVVDPAAATLTTDDEDTLTATAYDADGNTWDVTDTAATTWDAPGSQDPVSNGIYRADTVGTWYVVATYDGAADTFIATVLHGGAITLDVNPPSASLTADNQLLLSAVATDGDGNAWVVTDTVATTWTHPGSRTAVTAGVYQADTVGTWHIVALYDALRDTCIATVTHGVIDSLSVTPESSSVTADTVLQLTATAFDDDKNSWTLTGAVVWGTDDVSVTVTGGQYAPDSVGSYRVYADTGIYTDTAYVAVSHGGAVAIDITPVSDSIIAGDTITYTVTAVDLDSNAWDVTALSTFGVAPAGPDTSGSRITGTVRGNYTVTGRYLALTDNAALRITPDSPDTVWISVPAAYTEIQAGGTRSITAQVRDRFGNRVSDTTDVDWTWFAWDADNVGGGESFSVDPSPVVNGQAQTVFTPSTVNGDSFGVVAVVGALRDTTPAIGVIANTMDHVLIHFADMDTADRDTVVTTDNDTLALSVYGYDAANNNLGLVDGAWSMLDDSVGGLAPLAGNTTVLRADNPETVRIAVAVTALGTYYDTTAFVIVRVGTLATLVIAPDESTVSADDSIAFTAAGYDADGNETPSLGTLTWSGAGAIGSIGAASGMFTASTVGADTVRLASSLNGVTDVTGLITVVHGATDSVSLVPAAVSLTADDSVTLTFTAFDADKNSWDVTDTVATTWTWPGATDSIINGIYRAGTAGVHYVTASYDGIVDTCIITIGHGGAVALNVTPATDTVTADDQILLAAVATDADGNSWDVTDTTATVWTAPGSKTPVTSGVYTADTVGTRRIVALYDGLRDTCIAVVTHGAIDSMSVTPATASRTTDQTLAFTARAFDADKNSWLVTDTATGTVWGTDDPVGSVSNALYTMDTVGIYRVWAVNGLVSDTATVTVSHGVIVALTVTPDSALVASNDTIVLTATAADADGNEWDVTPDASGTLWETDEPGHPGVNDGIYSPSLTGFFRVWAVNGTASDTAYITTGHGAPVRIVVTPAARSLTADDSVSMTVTAYDIANNAWNVTGDSLTTWSAPGSRDSVINGIYRADTTGIFYVTATFAGYKDTCIATVTHGVIVSLDVSPAADSLTTDDTLHLTATAMDADGNTWDVTGAAGTVWGTDEPSKTVTAGVYEPDVDGSYRIWAVNGGSSDTCFAVVSHGATDHIVVSPASRTMTADDTLVMTAFAYDADGNAWNITDTAAAVWTHPGSRDTVGDGVYRADTAGIHFVTATYDGYADTCVVTVTHGIIRTLTVAPGTAAMSTDDTLHLTAAGTDTDGNVWNVTLNASGTVWGTDEPSKTVIDGVYEPDAVGAFLVWAVNGGVSDTCSVAVTHGVTDRIDLQPANWTMTTDDTLILALTAYDADNNGWDVTDTAATVWQATGTRDAVVNGVYRADTAGSHLVIAAYDGFADTCAVTVNHGGAVALDITPDAATITTDDSVVFIATAADADGNNWNVTSAVSWNAQGPDTATFAGGIFRPVRTGAYLIFTDYAGHADTSTVTVLHGATVRLVLVPPSASLTADDTLVLAVTAYDAEDNAWDVTDTAATTWLATGTQSGIVNGVYRADTVGNHTVVAGYDGFADTCAVTVVHGAVTVLDVQPDADTLTADDSLALTATAYDADGNSWDVTAVITWTAAGPETLTFFNGLFTPDTMGMYAVRTVYNGAADTARVLVRHGATVNLDLRPDNAGITADDTLQMILTAYDGKGNSWDVTDTVATTWTATGSEDPVMNGVYRADTVGAETVIAVYDGFADTTLITVGHGATVRIHMVPEDTTVLAGTQVQYVITAADADSNEWDVSFACFIVPDPDTGFIILGSSVTGTCADSFLLVATHDSMHDTSAITILPNVPDEIIFLNPPAGGTDSVLAGGSTFVDIRVTDAYGNVVPDTATIVWDWYDPAPANAGGGAGLGADTTVTAGGTTGVKFYVSTVTRDDYRVVARLAADASVIDTSGQVLVVSKEMSRIRIVLTDSTTELQDTSITTDNDGLRLMVAGFDALGNLLGYFDAEWSFSGDSVGTLHPATGTVCTLEAHTTGTTQIAAAVFDTSRALYFNDLTGIIEVLPGTLVALTLTPAADTITTDDSLRFTVTGYDADGNTGADPGTLAWHGATAIGTLDSTGLFDATTVGTDSVWVISSHHGIADTAGPLAVLHGVRVRLAITPDSALIRPDSVLQLTATSYDADGNGWNVTDTAAWQVSDTAVTADSGLFSWPTAGTYRVSAVYGTVADTIPVIVIHGPADTLRIFPADTTITADDVVQLTGTAYDIYGNTWDVTPADSGSVWSIDSTGAGTLVNGLFDPQVTGSYRISLAYGGLADTAGVTVLPGAVVSMDLTPDSVYLASDSTVTFVLTATDADGNTWDITNHDSTVWVLTDTTGSLDSGLYNPAAVGSYTLTALHRGFTDTSRITVVFGAIDSIALIPDVDTISADSVLQFTFLIYDSDRNVQDVTAAASWSVDSLAGSITDSGLFDPVKSSPSPWPVIVVYQTVTDTAWILVNVGAVYVLTINNGPDSAGVEFGDTLVTAGTPLPMWAVAFDRDGNFYGHADGDWSILDGDAADSLSAAAGTSVVFHPRRTGTVRVVFTDGGSGIDTTGYITITASPVVDHYKVRLSDKWVDRNAQVACSLMVMDAYENRILSFDHNPRQINITVSVDEFHDAPSGETRFLDAVGAVVDADNNNGNIKANSAFDQGLKLIYIIYDATEESLYFTFTDVDSAHITGTSPGVIWKSPELLAVFEAYPNPLNVAGSVPMTFHYLLKYQADVWIRIFGMDGSFVADRIYRTGENGGRAGDNYVTWDGRNDRGRFVESGAYHVRIWIEGKDENGNPFEASDALKAGILRGRY